MKIPVKKLCEKAVLPTYGSAGAAGADLYACLDEPVTVEPGRSAWIPTGLSMAIPEGFAGLIYARSGMACKQGLAPANKVGVIDSDYRGPIVVVLHNHSGESRTVRHGDRIAQMLITPVWTAEYEPADSLPDTQRNAGGFGSTGA